MIIPTCSVLTASSRNPWSPGPPAPSLQFFPAAAIRRTLALDPRPACRSPPPSLAEFLPTQTATKIITIIATPATIEAADEAACPFAPPFLRFGVFVWLHVETRIGHHHVFLAAGDWVLLAATAVIPRHYRQSGANSKPRAAGVPCNLRDFRRSCQAIYDGHQPRTLRLPDDSHGQSRRHELSARRPPRDAHRPRHRLPYLAARSALLARPRHPHVHARGLGHPRRQKPQRHDWSTARRSTRPRSSTATRSSVGSHEFEFHESDEPPTAQGDDPQLTQTIVQDLPIAVQESTRRGARRRCRARAGEGADAAVSALHQAARLRRSEST